MDLDEAAGPPGSTVRHLLAHASGLPFEGTTPIAEPGRRRIYSNEGFRVLGAHVAARAEMAFSDYVRAAVCEPLSIALDPTGDPGSGMHASLSDVLAVGRELLLPTVVAEETRAEMTSVQFPGLTGVLPDWGASIRSIGASASRSRARRSRTGRDRGRPRARSGTSVDQGRSSGSIPMQVWRAPRWRTASSATGRRRHGPLSRMPCSRRLDASPRRAGGSTRRRSLRRSLPRRKWSSP